MKTQYRVIFPYETIEGTRLGSSKWYDDENEAMYSSAWKRTGATIVTRELEDIPSLKELSAQRYEGIKQTCIIGISMNLCDSIQQNSYGTRCPCVLDHFTK